MIFIFFRHLFRSKELVTLLNRLGHCENYSFSLELETAIATAVRLNSSILTDKIIRNPVGPSVFHSEFDNYDQLVNDLSGKGSIHTAHGIMLQEVDATVNKTSHEAPIITHDKKGLWRVNYLLSWMNTTFHSESLQFLTSRELPCQDVKMHF